MKASVEINATIDKVVKLFMDKNHLKDWKKGFVSYEHISGTPNDAGAVTKMIYKRNVMIETILSINLPDEIIAEYEHIQGGSTMMFHKATNRFTSLGKSKTLYVLDGEITKVNGILLKFLMKLSPNEGNKQAQEQLNMFKLLAEKKYNK